MAMGLFACKNGMDIRYSVNEGKSKLQESFTLMKVAEKMYPLDSSTVPQSESIFYYEGDSQNYLTFYNKPSNSICFFTDSGRLAFKTQLEKTGKNGVGKAEGHYVYTLDSIFILDRRNKKISLVNHQGKVINTFSFPRNTNKQKILPAPMLSTVNPWLLNNGKIFGSGFILGELDEENATNRPVAIGYELNSRLPDYFFSYPDIYQDANWGGYNYRSVYSTFDDSDNLVVSFPADHNLYKINLANKQVSKYYAGSKYIDSIPSLQLRKKDFHDKWFMNTYFGSNPSYSTIIFDKFRQVYYRFVDLPIKDYNEDIKERSVKPFNIVILGKNMEWLGEMKIPQLTHSRIAFFVSKQGLHLRKYENNEDNMTFSVFQLTPLKKSLANK
jgi:hypothetical protein